MGIRDWIAPGSSSRKPPAAAPRATVKWIHLIVALLVAVALAAACSDDESADAEPAAETEQVTTTAAEPEPAPEPPLSMRNWEQVVADPEGFEGREVRGLVGKVFVVERDADGTFVQMNTTNGLSDGNTIVGIFDQAVGRGIREDEYLRVDGIVAGAFTGENAFGGEIVAPLVRASSAREIGAGAAILAADPPVATRRLNVVAEQAGVRVTLRRVDRLSSGGRLVVEVTNRSGAAASVYDSSATLIQGNRQSEAEYTFDLPSLPSEIQNGITATTILSFSTMRRGQARLLIDWFSDNFDITTEPFELPFRVP